MRRQRVLKRTSEICLFCRLNLAPASFLNNRRTLSTNGVQRQQGAAAAAAEAPNDDVAPPPPTIDASREWWDADAKLSAEEQRWKEERERHRLGQEQRARELEELKRKQASEAEQARQEQERKKREDQKQQFRKEQQENRRQAKASRASRPKQVVNKEQVKSSSNDQEVQTRTVDKAPGTTNAPNKKFYRLSMKEPEPVHDQPRIRRDSGEVDIRKRQVAALDSRRRSGGDSRRPYNDRTQRQQQRGGPFDDRFARGSKQPVEKVEMPSFGGAAASTATETRAASDGWGSGPIQRANLVYNDAPVVNRPPIVQNENIVDVEDLHPKSQESNVQEDPDAALQSDAAQAYEPTAASSSSEDGDQAAQRLSSDMRDVQEAPPELFSSERSSEPGPSEASNDGWGSGSALKAPLTYNDAPSAQAVDHEADDALNASQRQVEETSSADAVPQEASQSLPESELDTQTLVERQPEPADQPPLEQGKVQPAPGLSEGPSSSSSIEAMKTTSSKNVSEKPVQPATVQQSKLNSALAESSHEPATSQHVGSPARSIPQSVRPQPSVEQRRTEPEAKNNEVSPVASRDSNEPMKSAQRQGAIYDGPLRNFQGTWHTLSDDKQLAIAKVIFGGTNPATAQNMWHIMSDEQQLAIARVTMGGANPATSENMLHSLNDEQQRAIVQIVWFPVKSAAAQNVQPTQQPVHQQPQNPVYRAAWQRAKQGQPQERIAARSAVPSEDWDAPSPARRNGSGWGLDEPEARLLSTTRQSEQPTQPAQQRQHTHSYQQSQHGESGYVATMFDPQELYQQQQSSADDDLSANWQHLRRQNSQAPPPQQKKPAPPPPPPAQSQHEEPFSSDAVDRMFQKHRESRAPPPQPAASPAPARPVYDNPFAAPQVPQVSLAPFNNRSRAREDMVCGRCQQKGHHARDCTGPVMKQQEWRPQAPGNQRRQRQQQEQHRDQQLTPGNERQQRQTREGRPSNLFRSGEAQDAKRTSNPFDPVSNQREGPQRSANPFAASSFGVNDGQDFSKAADRAERRAHLEPMYDSASEKSMRKGRLRNDDETSQDFDRPARRGRFRATEQEDDDAMSDVASRVFRRQSKFADEDEVEERGGRGRDQGRKARGRQRDEDDEDDEAAAAREERNLRKMERQARAREVKESRAAEKKAKQEEERHQLKLPEFINVSTLAQTLGVRYETFVRRLERLGYDDIFPGKVLNSETSGMIAMEYDYDPIFEPANEADERDLKTRPEPENKENLPARPPVVTIMGHVDHGKTTILDYLRKSSVAAGEAGGITQHIGAFSVPLASSGKTITFLDTPGHAAFLAMRQRGANVTDIVILVVAADDSVKPQTLEALKHAQAAKVPIIVAVNKIDKEAADLQRVKQDLARHGVEIEDFGGETQVVPVSGKTGQGMGMLEENIVTLSEILDHRAEIDGPVEGWVLEATTKDRGRVATVLVRRGTLKTGTVIVAGRSWARVRSLRNEAGQGVEHAGPGIPVEVDGWREQPVAGDEVLEAPSEQKATDVVEYRVEKVEREKTAVDMEAINETRKAEQDKREKERVAQRASKFAAYSEFFEAAADPGDEDTAEAQEEQSSGPKSVPFIIKADVSGSAEAVSAYILSISSPLIMPRILKSEVGSINPSDVELAAAAQGHIVAFNLPPDEGIKGSAESKGVKVLENNVIYRVLDDVKAVLEDMLPPVVTQRVLGEAEIGQAFEIGIGGRKKMKIAGCKVRNGVVGKNHRVRVMRGNEKIYDGTMSSLKNVKKDVQEMRKGTECGIGFDGWESFEVGDQIQTYEEVSEKRKL